MLTIEEIEAANQRSEPIPASDAVHARMQFPLKRRFFPLGFPVDIATNCKEVIEAAEEAWASFTGLFNTPPIVIQVGVLEGSSSECPPAPSCRVQGHLFSFIADRDNFGVIDLAGGFSSIWLTMAAVDNRSYLRYFFLECAMFCQISNRYATGVHSGCVALNGIGILLCGDSGAGKSTLSYACAKAGWTYVTDDGSFVVHQRERLMAVGNCYQVRFRPSSSSIFPEIEGRSVTHRSEVGKPSIEFGTATLQGIRSSQSANIDFLVFLNRREGVNANLRPYSKKVAGDYLKQGRFSPPDVMLRHSSVIEKLLSLDVLELRYHDLDWAVEQLNTLAGAKR